MSVPYHTRPDSKPFSYSSVRSRSSSLNRKGCESPREGGGALLSTGLASPRLIRKVLGESTSETSTYNTNQTHPYFESSSPPKTDSEESFREVPIRKSNLDFYELTREKESLIQPTPKKSGLTEKSFDIKSSNSFDNFISSKKSPEEYYTKKSSPEDIYNTINKTTTPITEDYYGKKSTTTSDTWKSKNSFSEDFYSSKKTNLDDLSLQKASSPNDIDFKRNPFEDFDLKKPSLNGDSFSKKTLNEMYHVPIKVEQSDDEIIRDTSTSMADALMNKKNDESWLEKQLQKLKERKGFSTTSPSILTSANVSSLNNNLYKSPSMTYTPISSYSTTINNNDELESPRAKSHQDSAFDNKGIRIPIQREDKSSLLSDASSYTLGYQTLERQRSDTFNDRSRSASGIRRQRVDSESSELGALDTSTLHQKLMAASLENGSSSRPITPAFPPGTPYNNRSRANTRAPSPCGLYSSTTRRGSIGSIHSSEISGEESAINVKLVRDNFKYWYKPSITREEAIALLKQRPPGTFIVRDSHSFPGAYGLALKVSKPPPAPSKPRNPAADPLDELVRHFLIEPTTKGVKLKGYSNEPIFASLSSLVYQHSLTALALPTKLVLPQYDLTLDNVDDGGNNIHETKHDSMRKLFDSGAACNVSYLFTMETDALTGGVAVDKTVSTFLELTKDIDNNPGLVVVDVHFKVTTQGITVTDNERKLFFRKHYNISTIGYCGLDPQNRIYVKSSPATKIFAFVAKKHGSRTHNQCHLFAALDPEQPAVAIVNFVNRVLAMTNPKRIEMV